MSKENSNTEIKMPYGKFKGRLVRNLPSPYLKWVAENWKEDTETNRNIITTADEEYQERNKYNTHHLYE